MLYQYKQRPRVHAVDVGMPSNCAIISAGNVTEFDFCTVHSKFRYVLDSPVCRGVEIAENITLPKFLDLQYSTLFLYGQTILISKAPN